MDWDVFNAYIHVQAKEALRVTGMEIEKIIKDYIKKVWYDPWTPTAYTRTYDYLNSLTVSKVKTVSVNRYEIEIYFDTSKIIPRDSDGSGRWPSHQNITNGEYFSYYLPAWIEWGNLSSRYPYATKTGGQPMTKAFKELRDTQFHVRRIKSILLSKGIYVNFTGYIKLNSPK